MSTSVVTQPTTDAARPGAVRTSSTNLLLFTACFHYVLVLDSLDPTFVRYETMGGGRTS